MKTFNLIILLTAIFVMACTEDNLLNTADKNRYIDGELVKCTGNVIMVSPNGNDDTENLMAAFAAARSGSIIRLTEGVYHIGYMEIHDFCGSLIGAGKDRTILYPKTPIDSRSQLVDRNILNAWWRFIGGNVVISKMTFNTHVPEPVQNYNDDFYWGKDLYAILIFNDYDVNSPADESYQKVFLKDLKFIGGYDDAGGDPASFQWRTDHNVIIGAWVGLDYNFPLPDTRYTLTKGEYTVENCSFDHFIVGAEGFGMGEDATMKVTSCRFNDCIWQAYFTANYNSKVDLSYNVFTGTTGSDVVIEDNEWGLVYGFADIEPIRRSQYSLSGNIFNAVPNSSSVVLWDMWLAQNSDDILPMQLKLRGNVFNLTGGSTGITAINSQDALIANNWFRGSCSAGILVDGIATDRFGTPLLNPDKAKANNVLVLGNNFAGLESEQAEIILGEGSTNCTVAGSGKADVIDNGTNNKVTGMKPPHQGYQFGPVIRDHHRIPHGRH